MGVKAASSSEAGATSPRPGMLPGPNLEPANRPLRIGLIAAVAVNCGAGLGFMGWGALQGLGLVPEPAVESVQREQGAAISRLDETANGLTAAVAGLSARVYSADEREEARNRRMAEIDASLGVLRTGMDELRAAQNAAEESWREPVAELKAEAAKTRGEVVRLRASIDEFTRSRQPEIAAIGARIGRIERAVVQHNVPGPIRGSIQEPTPRRGPLAAPETSPAPDGHIINLPPVP